MTDPDRDERTRPANTHPAELPCIDPDCKAGRGRILCLRCSGRVHRAATAHRVRQTQHRNRPKLFRDEEAT